MTALVGYNEKAGQWVPIDIRPRLCHLLLQAQWLEVQGIKTEFWLGMEPPVFMEGEYANEVENTL